ncbi:hypothetical protein Y032_0060g3167 [Ancylostoma ceylanicum]|uniref:Uncharacterized protein n=1 Tax=Ancylostoma ceylanicum TaxID=53326 RepID=A0A016U3L5_9BILA|nr:hypothetical protein Y032_0060g3167 [Ancylostoma ceylanicum]
MIDSSTFKSLIFTRATQCVHDLRESSYNYWPNQSMGEQIELVGNGSVPNNGRIRPPLQKMSTHEITIGTDLDPFNKPEHVHTLKGRELYLFVIFYTVAVFLIVMMFEFFMPVLFNPNYPDME